MAIGLLSVISIMILVLAFLTWRESRLLEARLVPLREAGKPLSIQDLATLPIPDQQNAAKALEPLKDAFDKFNQQFVKATAKWETVEQYESASVEVARSIDNAFPQLNAELRAACGLTDFQPDCDFSRGPSVLLEDVTEYLGSARTPARILYGHGLMSLADGNTDGAMRDAIAMLRWSEHIAQEPLLVNYLVSAAVFSHATELVARSLYAGDASPAVRSELLSVFNDTADDATLLENFSRTIDSERAFGISSLDSFHYVSRFQLMLGAVSAYLDAVAEFDSIARKPFGLAPERPTTEGVFASLVWPGVPTAVTTVRRSQALSRAVRILAAWQDHGADVNAKLDDLGLPELVTIDPFDGTKMKLKVIGETIAVYSVDLNLVDDNGTLTDGKDLGIAPK
jgi:hypothetical protein